MRLILILWMLLSAPVYAEGEIVFPDFPSNFDLQSSSWAEVEILDHLSETAFLYLPSIVHEGDDVRYILNLRSQGGVHNVSVENLQCTGRATQTIAFGDIMEKKWIASAVDLSHHPVRRRLLGVFCDGEYPDTIDRIKRRLRR